MTEENLNFFLDILRIDSTSQKEMALSSFIKSSAAFSRAQTEVQPVGDGTENLFFKWGMPRIIFCTHLDTVPPYIAPSISLSGDKSKGTEEVIVKGRGSCDAKGQILTQYIVARQLEDEGYNDFGILWVSGEETGSLGARKANSMIKGADFVIVGEPTDNRLISAAKGTALYNVKIGGKGAHSGYPEEGDDALKRFVNFYHDLSATDLPSDPILGETTWNIGRLTSSNPFNVIPSEILFSLYLRTTFATHPLIDSITERFANDKIEITPVSKSNPMRFHTEEGFPTGVVAYGSDAPLLSNAASVMLYGPGSILKAHTDYESITINEIDMAVKDLKNIFLKLKDRLA